MLIKATGMPPTTHFFAIKMGSRLATCLKPGESAISLVKVFVELQSIPVAMAGTQCLKVSHLGSYLGWL